MLKPHTHNSALPIFLSVGMFNCNGTYGVFPLFRALRDILCPEALLFGDKLFHNFAISLFMYHRYWQLCKSSRGVAGPSGTFVVKYDFLLAEPPKTLRCKRQEGLNIVWLDC